MGKNLLLDAENQSLKAEKLFKANQFKKAAKKYNSAGHTYLKLEKYEKAKNSFINGANTFLESGKVQSSLELLRMAGDSSILNENYKEADEIFRKAVDFVPKLKSIADRNSHYVLFSVLSYLCLFTNARQDDGLNFIKKVQNKIESSYFKENPLVILVTDLTIALRDKNPVYLEKVQNNLQNYKLTNAELLLIRKILFMANFQLLLKSELALDKGTYTTNEIIKLKLKVDTKPLMQVIQNSFYNLKVEKFSIVKFNLNFSDNLSASKRPDLPIDMEIEKIYELDFIIKPHFQLDNPFIGPFSLTCELNNKLTFIYDTAEIKPDLISPPPSLDISTKNLRTPLIGQTFPLEILVKNQSEGEALDVNIETEFPEQLKIMRGTTIKQIYSLRPMEEIKWEINLKPIEAGDYNIRILVKFKDPDQNPIEEIKEFPLSIKL
jgi:tetratricopeptide (TPR) repeat protein